MYEFSDLFTGHEYDSITTEIDMAVSETNSDRVWIQPTFGRSIPVHALFLKFIYAAGYPWDQWSGNIVLTMVCNF